MRIAIFGGSFDPPHNGHKGIIEQVLNKLQIDLLIILVAYQNPFKSNYRIHAQKRFIWIKKICESYNNVLCSDYEILQNKPTTTKDSIEYFKSLYNPSKFYFILGQDNFLQLPQWRNFDTLRKNLYFIVFERITKVSLDTLDNRQDICKQFAQKHNIKMKYFKFSYPYSSSIIMQNIAYYKNEIPDNIRNDVIESYKALHNS